MHAHLLRRRPLPDDVATLQARLVALAAQLTEQLAERDQAVMARDRIIATLKEQLTALRRQTFGRRSEKLHRTAEQLELQSEELEQQQAERAATPTPADTVSAAERAHPIRQPRPAHLPRVEETLAPPCAACPGCGEVLRRIGEDVSEVLGVVPARLRRYVRPVMACRCRCRRAMPAPAYWPRACWPSTTITCRPTGRPNASPARAWRCRARP